MPAFRVVERDDAQIVVWVKETWFRGGRFAAALDARLWFEDDAGLSMTLSAHPHLDRPRTTPIVAECGCFRRLSIASLTRDKPGERVRVTYRARRDEHW